MNKKTLLLMTMTFGAINVASSNNNMYIAKHDVSGKASSAVKTKKPIKDVKWSGIVVQTTNNEKDTCYQIIETQDSPQGRPSYDMLTYANSFIACKDNTGEAEQYNNSLVSISGDVVSYHYSKKANLDFPILEIKEVKEISRTRSYVKSTSNRNSSEFDGITFYDDNRSSYDHVASPTRYTNYSND